MTALLSIAGWYRFPSPTMSATAGGYGSSTLMDVGVAGSTALRTAKGLLFCPLPPAPFFPFTSLEACTSSVPPGLPPAPISVRVSAWFPNVCTIALAGLSTGLAFPVAGFFPSTPPVARLVPLLTRSSSLLGVGLGCSSFFLWYSTPVAGKPGRCLEQERAALLDIKLSIINPRSLLDWKEENCCEWSGVTCNSSTSRVTQLDLTYLSSSLWYPNATLFSQLKDLETLDLFGNQIGGLVMPQELCKLRSLKELGLSNNQLSWLPSFLGNLSSLEYLFLSNNHIKESDALEDLCRLTNLQVLLLDGNELNGLPPCISNMSSLGYLSLDTFDFTSPLAVKDFCGSRNLLSLSLGWNLLNPIPPCLRNLLDIEINISRISDHNKAIAPDALEGLCIFTNLKKLIINDNQLVDGSIPPCFGNLSSLYYLDFSSNQLKGSLDLCGLQNLLYLKLDGNQLTQLPHCLGNLTSLTGLELGNNNLSESTSLEGLCIFTNLKLLFINDNQLVDGSIPPCFGNLSSLQYLDLSSNQLKGSLGLCMLTNLQSLFINDNQFVDGSIPPCFGNLSSLVDLYLSSNQLKGSLGLCGLQNLTDLDISWNQLTHLPRCLGNLTSLGWLDLSYNNLNTSTSLEGLCMLPKLESLYLSQNSLWGSIRSCFSHLHSLLRMDLSSNQFQGMLPIDIGFLLPNLIKLNMSSNLLQGSIPQTFGSMRNLWILDLSNNNISGEIPNQLLTNTTSLQYLDLSNNGLQGDLFSRDFHMPNIKALYLNGNQLTGMIPQTLCNSPLLKILDIGDNSLSGAIPSWFSYLSELNALVVKRNYFNGQIPIKLCEMKNLRILDLSHNHLTGNIPSCFNNITSWKEKSQSEITIYDATANVEFMTKGNLYSYGGIVLTLMTGIDISSNQLTENVPIELGYLSELHSLNLSHNSLTGQIPESFKCLEQIESLDMSFNELNGTIPPSLVQLYRISIFNVAHNNLYGRVPNEKQFATFDENSYEGNIGLCGMPLKKNCSPDSIPMVKQEGADSDIIDNRFLFYSMIATTYILGFWGGIFLLYFNKKLRRYSETIVEYIHSFLMDRWDFFY